MKKMILPACMLALLACAPQQKEENKAASVAELPAKNEAQVFPWLHGKWMIDYGDTKVYEQWEQQNERLLTGMGYVVSGKDTVVKEVMHIEKVGHAWVFIASINNSAPVLFSCTQTELDNKLIFKNPEHDFPQQITYGSGAENKLFATVEGKEKGKSKKEEYNYTRY